MQNSSKIQNLHSILSAFGDLVELDYQFDCDKTINELSSLTNWQEVINNKKAINLNGPIDSLMGHKHDKDNQDYNDNLLKCPSIIDFFDKFDIARCRAFSLNKGSYFAPHRDAWRYNEQFRIFIPLNKVDKSDWMFYLDDKFVQFKPGVPYILNTRKVHGSFSFADDIYHIIMSVYLTEENMDAILKLIPYYNEK